MNDKFEPYLCGGIFFSLLIELHDTSVNYKVGFGEKKPITHSDIMINLIHVIEPKYHIKEKKTIETIKKNTSHYRTCISDGGSVLRFDKDDVREEFNDCVRKKYREVLKRMKEFTDKSFPECDNKFEKCLLIKRTLTLIRDDNEIGENELFLLTKMGLLYRKNSFSKKKSSIFNHF